MNRLSKVVRGVLAMVALGAVVAMASSAALADEGGNGNDNGSSSPLNPAYQVGNAQGDGNGQ